MTRLVRRMTGWAALAAAAVTAISGCMDDAYAESPAQVRQQAGMVSLMIGTAMGTGQITEADLIRIVEGDGGGYVTAITRAGQAGTAGQRTTVHAVLGTSITSGNGPDEGIGKPVVEIPAVQCYRFTVGYYPYQVWQADERCPSPRPGAAGGFMATATAEASRIWSAQNVIARLPRAAQAQIRAAPVSLSQARHLLGLDWRARKAAGILPVADSEFAVGHGRAALALRLRAGGCVYLSLPDNPEGGGLPGPWLSPVHAPCTGAAALAASGWISNNPAAGG